MSQFDSYLTIHYLEKMRKFLGVTRADFACRLGRVTGQVGRRRNPSAGKIEAVEYEVNRRAQQVEETICQSERLSIAMDYMQVTSAGLARAVGVSREWVRQWRNAEHEPTRFEAIAAYLQIPAGWLEFGGQEKIPANSPIGVRVGNEARKYREIAYAHSLGVISQADTECETEVNSLIDAAVFADPAFTQVSRRAGGRWVVQNGKLVFSPWKPLPMRKLHRRVWSDRFEEIAAEELSSKATVKAAYNAIKARCDEEKVASCTLIALYKRIELKRNRIERFGLHPEQF